MTRQGMTLNQHLWQQQAYLNIPTKLAILLVQIGFAAKILSYTNDNAAVVSKLDKAGEKNTTNNQGKLDAFTNETVMEAFSQTKLVTALASKQLIELNYTDDSSDSEYILRFNVFDNLPHKETSKSTSTIFAIYEQITSNNSYCYLGQEMLHQSVELIAAGYIMYGTRTVLVYAYDHSVNSFTLDPNKGEFLLSHPNICCPIRGQSYCANLHHYYQWYPQIRRFVDYLNDYHPATNRPYLMHFTGDKLADIHRTLLEGGVYFEPNAGYEDSKLRLLEDCVPLAFIFEQAGGRASNGKEHILDCPIKFGEKRSPLVIGSEADVLLYERFLRNRL